MVPTKQVLKHGITTLEIWNLCFIFFEMMFDLMSDEVRSKQILESKKVKKSFPHFSRTRTRTLNPTSKTNPHPHLHLHPIY